jgi:hypothetical protein
VSSRVAAPLAAVIVALGVASDGVGQEPETVAEPVAPDAVVAPAPFTQYRLRAVRVETQDIFRPQETGERVIPRILNAAHAKTRTETVMREMFVHPGDLVDASHAEELARNLRALGIFAEVEVALVPASTPGEADLVVRTRDRLTLAVGGGVSYVGGATGFNASVSESNFFGNGDRLAASFRQNDEGDFRGVGSWNDLHLLDTWMTGSLRLSRTDDGDGIGVEVARPFKHLRDPRSWRVGASYDELAQEYYVLGEESGSVPYERAAAEGELAGLDGDRFARSGFGIQARVADVGYGAAEGSLAPDLRVPGDTRTMFVGPTYRGRWIDGFRTATAIDTLGYVQDIALATEIELAVGCVLRDEDGRDFETQPAIDAHLGFAAEPSAGWLVGCASDGALRWGDDGLVGWRAAARAQSVRMWNDAHALAGTVRFDAGDEDQDLELQLTLGADSGLRGYDARLFAGTRRLVASVEERWDTGVEIWAFRFGLAAFCDSGWLSDGPSLGRPYLGAGGGVRIGSAPLFGSTVLRMDITTALDDAVGNTDGVEFSVVVGQAFTFGGAARIPATR